MTTTRYVKRLLAAAIFAQILPGPDIRFEGGFATHDATEPWGPWTTAYSTDSWAVGPGETSSLPTRWIGDDGKTFHLVFSGDDHDSVRQGRLRLAQ